MFGDHVLNISRLFIAFHRLHPGCGSLSFSFFEEGIKGSFRIESTFVCQAQEREVLIFRVKCFGLKSLQAEGIDKFIKIFADVLIEDPGKVY